jgi:hypothetical protein
VQHKLSLTLLRRLGPGSVRQGLLLLQQRVLCAPASIYRQHLQRVICPTSRAQPGDPAQRLGAKLGAEQQRRRRAAMVTAAAAAAPAAVTSPVGAMTSIILNQILKL